jgi:hypothetical protein
MLTTKHNNCCCWRRTDVRIEAIYSGSRPSGVFLPVKGLGFVLEAWAVVMRCKHLSLCLSVQFEISVRLNKWFLRYWMQAIESCSKSHHLFRQWSEQGIKVLPHVGLLAELVNDTSRCTWLLSLDIYVSTDWTEISALEVSIVILNHISAHGINRIKISVFSN